MAVQDRPLLVSAATDLIDEVVRLASSAALEVLVVPDLHQAQRFWMTAPLVIVGSDVSQEAPVGKRARLVVAHVNADIDGEVSDVGRDVWRFAVHLGAEHVVELPDGQAWLVDAFRECVEGPVRHGIVLPVFASSGGVGASTLSANLALVATRLGRRGLLVDADPWGGGIDLLVGLENSPGARWTDVQHVSGHLPAGHLDAALPRAGGVPVLSCSRVEPSGPTAESMAAVLASARRSNDVVVVDSSKVVDEVYRVIVDECRVAVLLVGDHVRSVASAGQVAARLKRGGLAIVVVVATSARGIPVDAVGQALETTPTAVLPFVPSMPSRADDGDLPPLPKAYSAACQHLLDAVHDEHHERSKNDGRVSDGRLLAHDR